MTTTRKHNDGFNEEYLRRDEAVALAEEINARPCWHANDPYLDYGPLYVMNVTYTPAGYLAHWHAATVKTRRQWQHMYEREERMARERASAAMNCNMVVQQWHEERSYPAGVQPGHWVDFAYVSMRQYGAMIGHWLHTRDHGIEGQRVQVVLIHGLGAYGDCVDRWPNRIDCGTDCWPCQHVPHKGGDDGDHRATPVT